MKLYIYEYTQYDKQHYRLWMSEWPYWLDNKPRWLPRWLEVL